MSQASADASLLSSAAEARLLPFSICDSAERLAPQLAPRDASV
jgi:hypothetical protein